MWCMSNEFPATEDKNLRGLMTNSDQVSNFIFEISSIQYVQMIDTLELELIDDLVDIATCFIRDATGVGVLVDDKIGLMIK